MVAGLLALGVGCGGGSSSSTGAAELRLRLESNDPHLTGIVEIEVALTRASLAERLRFTLESVGQPNLPVETVLSTSMGAGPADLEVFARGSGGEWLGGGDGAVRLVNGVATRAVIELFSARSDRPSRARPGVIDGGSFVSEDADVSVDAPTVLPTDASADRTQPTDGRHPTDAPQPAEVGCGIRTRLLTAVAAVSLDYGPPPRDAALARVAVGSGVSHGHTHDVVGWMRFDLRAVVDRASLVSARVMLTLDDPGSGPPPLELVYSSSDDWTTTTTSERAETIERTATVSGLLGTPRPGRAAYALDVARYRPFFAADLADDAVTIGVRSRTPLTSAETWAFFVGARGVDAPVLELTTCE